MLHAALTAAFASPGRARLLLRQAGIPVDLLDLAAPPERLWDEALSLAELRGMTEDLRASAASHHPEVAVFRGEASPSDPVAPAPANAVRKLTRVLAHNFNERDRQRVLREAGVEDAPALAADPRACVEALVLAGALRHAWEAIQAERPHILPLPYPDGIDDAPDELA